MCPMKTTPFHDLHLSRLMLGTAQFGLAYGIANTLGKPDISSVCAILNAARDCGINCLDTAAGYGDSEAVLGQALEETGLRGHFTVVTKLPHMAPEFSSTRAADDFVEAAVVRALERLKLDVLPICMFHLEQSFMHIESLLKMQQRGLVHYVGCSLNDPRSVPSMVEDGRAQAMQIPASILDDRFVRQGIQKAAPQSALFARSVYLQGLLLMPEEKIPQELEAVLPVRRALQTIARQAGLTPEELFIRYMLTIEGITSLVIGSETEAQVRHNTALIAAGPLATDVFAAARAAVPQLPELLLVPRQWSNRMPDVVPAKA